LNLAVLAFWVGYAAAELRPLWLRLREIILTSGKIAVDETTAPVLDPGRGSSSNSPASRATSTAFFMTERTMPDSQTPTMWEKTTTFHTSTPRRNADRTRC
jgi:hypothetical protein